jgi:uncharacterized membrane protein SpoIIM required for sporulation/ABC-type transport system involved in multi-copper enzyme maturation permease subunit
MLRSLRPALLIARREIRDQFRDWRIIFPILGLTLFFPFLMTFTANQILGFVQKYGANIIGERLVPFLLMIVGFFPISVSLVIALETFVGEKERGSIEPLLSTPLKDWQLYLGKLLAATVYPLLSSYMGMIVYLTGLYLNRVPWPEAPVLALVVVLTTVQALVMVAGAVVVSSQATSVRAANLLASFIIIPIALLVQGESVVMFWGTYQSLWWGVFGLFVLGILLARVGLAHFQREELLGREIDVLNVRWMISVFVGQFKGGAHSVWEWWRKVLPASIRRLGRPMLVVALIMAAGVYVGIRLLDQFYISMGQDAVSSMNQSLHSLVKLWPMFSVGPVIAIWWQNVRVLILAMLLGLFSFGILGMIPVFATMVAAGYLLALLSANGLPVMAYLAFIVPHGIVEIPAVILATAAVVQAGAILVTPTPGKTFGEVWLTAIAEWAKIMVGIVIPLLLIGACIEAWITPRIAVMFF